MSFSTLFGITKLKQLKYSVPSSRKYISKIDELFVPLLKICQVYSLS